MAPTAITQKTPTALVAVTAKAITAPTGWTTVSAKPALPTAIMQKPATGYTEVAQK